MAAPTITEYINEPAHPVYVTDAPAGGTNVNITDMQRCASGSPVGVVVSNGAAVQLLAANANARQRIISNNGSSNIFLGRDNTVTASGATMGIKLAPNGVYTDSGIDLDQGEIWAIGDAASAVENVSAWEKTA